MTVLNATAARGLSFRALFIVGMNEGVFPRTIREDAFLRDRDREVLERDLGYKVSQKLAGFDEEKLIFTLLVNAAQRAALLFVSTLGRKRQSAGAVVVSYRTETRAGRKRTQDNSSRIRFPRSISDKAESKPFDREELLLPEELAIRLSLAGKESNSLIEEANLSPASVQTGT